LVDITAAKLLVSFDVPGGDIIRLSTKKSYLAAACCLVGLGAGVLLGQASIVQHLNQWQLLPRSEALTELYFANPRHLPTSLSDNYTQKIAFVVRNLEHKTTTYHYKLIVKSIDSQTEREVGKGAFTLPYDHSRVSSVNIAVPRVAPQVEIKVSLSYTSTATGVDKPAEQSIHYWLKIAALQSGGEGGHVAA
jgi:hypothetical protein